MTSFLNSPPLTKEDILNKIVVFLFFAFLYFYLIISILHKHSKKISK